MATIYERMLDLQICRRNWFKFLGLLTTCSIQSNHIQRPKRCHLVKKFYQIHLGRLSKSFRKWIKDTAVPEESYLQILVRITKINKKRSKIIKVEHFDKSFDTTYDACLRFAKWSSYYWSNYQKCHGVYIRLICHLALEDYNEILEHFAITRNDPNKNACFMLNKFNLEVDLRPVLYLARLHSPILKGF